jgi:hypothetical protein
MSVLHCNMNKPFGYSLMYYKKELNLYMYYNICVYEVHYVQRISSRIPPLSSQTPENSLLVLVLVLLLVLLLLLLLLLLEVEVSIKDEKEGKKKHGDATSVSGRQSAAAVLALARPRD